MTTSSGTVTPLRAGLGHEPGPGTWVVDPSASTVAFSIRHLAVATVHGRFARFGGRLDIDDGGRGRVHGHVNVASVETGVELRDRRLRSDGCFDAERHPAMTFAGELDLLARGFVVGGDLTIKGRTRRVDLDGGVTAADAERLSISVGGEISRREFGLHWSDLLEGGVAVVGDRVSVVLDLRLART